MHMIHDTTIIHPSAFLESGVKVGPYAIIEEGVIVGEECEIGAHVHLKKGCRLGKRVYVDTHAVLSGLPQDLSFDPMTESFVDIGDDTIIREGVTVSRATKDGMSTSIGSGAYLMAGTHVGHDSVVGDHAILANNSLLAGHVKVGRYAFISGGSVIHQFVSIGESVMLSGLSAVSLDIPPFCLAATRNQIVGLNLIGMKRRNFSRESIKDVKRLFKEVFFESGGYLKRALALEISEAFKTDEGRRFLAFFKESHRGICPLRKAFKEES